VAIGAWSVGTAALSVFGIGQVEDVRSALLAATGGDRPSAGPPPPSVSPSPSAGSARVLRTPGGSITAHCEEGLTWADAVSPAIGHYVQDAQQGPDVEYRVTFKTDGREVRVVVRCDKTLTPTADVTLG
jgi:hypothetical protein